MGVSLRATFHAWTYIPFHTPRHFALRDADYTAPLTAQANRSTTCGRTCMRVGSMLFICIAAALVAAGCSNMTLPTSPSTVIGNASASSLSPAGTGRELVTLQAAAVPVLTWSPD